MARPESIALGGYFPTPPRLVPHFARLVSVKPKDEGDSRAAGYRPAGGDVSFLDPCVGEGQAVLGLIAAIDPPGEGEKHSDAEFYGVELEKIRYEACKAKLPWVWQQHLLHGDAFHAEWSASSPGVSCLFLNPPYDVDRVHGRLEQRFLARYTFALAEGGTLFFLVPHYALEASADWLATHFDRVECRRFPGPEYDVFRQIVLAARRGPALGAPQGKLAAKIRGWSTDPETIPVLSESEKPLWTLPRGPAHGEALRGWRMAPIDIKSILAQATPWGQTSRKGERQVVPGILPDPAGDLLRRTYPVATPPPASHIAAGIASGVFNGAELHPDDPATGLPPLLVKGVFDREYRTIEEKTNKDGEVTGLIQVQQPKLSVTALDLSTYKYTTLTPSVKPTDAATVADFATGDLLARYGKALLAALHEHCPVLHDPDRPGDAFPLPFQVKGEAPPDPTGPRQLFHAQAHAVMACVKLLGGPKARKAARRGKAALLLGEIGVGKSSVALATARVIKSDRTLIVCPPHLLQSWQDQIAAVTPWAAVSVLRTPSDVEAFATSPLRPAVAILSRETAKLGHALAGVKRGCPKCGGALPSVDLAKRRAVCELYQTKPADVHARRAVTLARIVGPLAPTDARVTPLLPERPMRLMLARAAQSETVPDVRENPRLHALARELAADVIAGTAYHAILFRLLAGIDSEDLTAGIALDLYEASRIDVTAHGQGQQLRDLARKLLLLLPPGGLAQRRAVKAMRANEIPEEKPSSYYADTKTAWEEFEEASKRLVEGQCAASWGPYHGIDTGPEGIEVDGKPVGDAEHLLVAIHKLTESGKWRATKPCGERLYQSTPEPRRVPLASYICRRHPRLFDLLVLDEAHEAANSDSAQSRAAHRLVALGLPTIALTGSVMNGYAESLFANLWALSPAFREEFQRDQRAAFVDRYGYKKRLVEEREDGKVVPIYGAVTDRLEASARDIGQAPGVLPLLILRHILPISVTLQKADLAIDLPPCREFPEHIEPDRKQGAAHDAMLKVLLKQIKDDRFEEDKAGRLFGALAEAPSQLDRATADTGNVEDGSYEIRYPESAGGDLVHRVAPLPASATLPKERWMLDKIEAELAEGRNVMVFAWHTNLLPRLARLVGEKIGAAQVAMLDPSKVPTGKREEWINRVIRKGCRVLCTNAAAVKTGLNPLVHFATEIFMESPACDPVTYRQAIGRVDRIGQTRETRIYFPTYDSPGQVQLHKLLMSKVAVSLATDGLDAEGALAAAGAGDAPEHSGLSVGRALYELLSKRPGRVA